MKLARILIIAGSDSGGGAGIQADIKTVTALGGYAATAMTAITVQDTKKVHEVFPLPPKLLKDQIRVVLEDIGADCIKVGMIGHVAAGEVILEALTPYQDIPLILDPVLVATSGDSLSNDAVPTLLKNEFFPRATLLTPNLQEAAILTNREVTDLASLTLAAGRLRQMGAKAVMAKGGHLPGDDVVNILLQDEGEKQLRLPRLDSRHTHGTGCTLAAAIATFVGQGDTLFEACRKANLYVHSAIKYAPGFGQGHGPLNHALRAIEDKGKVVGYTPF